MTKPELEKVNAELLAAAYAALKRLQQISVTEHADVRQQLAEAITRAHMNPKNWYLLAPVRKDHSDPFAGFGGKAA